MSLKWTGPGTSSGSWGGSRMSLKWTGPGTSSGNLGELRLV